MTSTNMDSIVQEFAQAFDDLLGAAMRETFGNWAEAPSSLPALPEAYANGRDRLESAT
ncbi:hypothetical protein [Roseicella aerolata]|uniref:Uncharacterized protein n=1 Tax=Roseicella aerolata TaxID=2883479 RepID=A0A9X1LAB4_9PROT|nr:hypothetical protein [Roseicella aerolata]MCB4821242.1 hypothetical protein [Roseicella aerolata]